LLSSRLFPTRRDKISGAGSWRNDILLPFIYEREGWKCWVADCANSAEQVHEGVISRQDVRGWKAKNKVLIHSPYNCIAVCRAHNVNPPDRYVVLEWMFEQYGQDDVLEWYLGLPFKAHPINFERYER
jgi:hypothetical protein